MDFSKRNYIFSFEILASPYASFIMLLESQFAKMFDEGDEDVFGVIFLKGDMFGG